MKLTEKQKKFIQEYLIDLNATQAAIRAGYSEKTAREIAHQNLTKLHIQEALQQERERLAEISTIATPEEILKGYTRDIRFDPRDLYDDNGNLMSVSDLEDDPALSLAGIKVTETIILGKDGEDKVVKRTTDYKLPDKKANRDSMGKTYGMFIDRKELTGKDGGPVEVKGHGMDLEKLREVMKDEKA